ncbi:hypothetical protein D915_010989 [Fasciola hepatica]|uniref:Uncharacterized protein n=1 Tax=Fasciola hepatica TaxID=6192 RepID=A0A4E0QSY3_FASHE|nr:hypothetical protein D915_010989 [Fasciola hepatica]
MDRFSDFITYDHSSVQATLVCVVFFWMLITVIAILTRRFLLHLSDKQPELFSCSQSYHSTPWGQFLYVWTNKVHLSHSLLLALLDSVATFEVCACSLECWTVREVVGKTGLLIAIAANGIRGLLFTCRDAYGNPCTPLYR